MGGQPQRKDQKVRGPPAEGVEDVVAVFDTPVAQSDIANAVKLMEPTSHGRSQEFHAKMLHLRS